MLIMQRMGYIRDPSAPSASELEAFDRLFDGNLTASEAEALDELFPAVGKAASKQPRRRKATKLRRYWLFLLCNIET